MRLSVRSDADESVSVRKKTRGHITEPWQYQHDRNLLTENEEALREYLENDSDIKVRG